MNENLTINCNLQNLSDDERNQLMAIIEKANKPVSKMWRPEYDDRYFIIAEDGKISTRWDRNKKLTDDTIAMGNCFKTQEEAEFEAECRRVETKLRQFAMENNEDIDWSDNESTKWFITYDHTNNCVDVDYYHILQSADVYFSSRTFAEKAIKEIGEENLKKYYFRIKED